MDEWHDYFLAQAGAAGVLTGLVFVAVSINLQQIVSDPGSGLPGRAAEALILLVAVLTASVLLLVPGQGQLMVGVEVLVWARHLGVGRGHSGAAAAELGYYEARPAPAFRVHSAVSDRHATVGGRRHRRDGSGVRGLYWLVAGMIFATIVALFEAWVLLVEIDR